MIKSSIYMLQAVLITLTLFWSVCTWAVVPYINYQGKLTDSLGAPVNDPALVMKFTIWLDPTSEDIADLIFEEKHSVNVTNGIYNVMLGSDSGGLGDPINFSSNYELWLEVSVDGETLSPRTSITSVPSAIWADMAADAETLAGMDATAFVAASEYNLHTADPSAHHSKYTHTDAVTAMGVKADTNPLNHDKTTSFTELTGQAADAQIPSTVIRLSDLISHSLSPSVHHAKYADADALAAIQATDGAGSTLDADLLDGQHASEIIDAAADEVRTPISSLPFIISASGSYYLTADLNLSGTAANGITVAADNVTIDFMGFSISGPGSGTGNGIYLYNRSNVEIRNGTIAGFGSVGVYESGLAAKSHRIVEVRVLGNGGTGMMLRGSGNLIKDCTVRDNGGYGIYGGSGSTITGNTSFNNNSIGIVSDTGSTIRGNAVRSNGGIGISLNDFCTVTGNTVHENTFSGIQSQRGSTILNNTVAENNQANLPAYSGIQVSFDSQIKGNTLNGNLQNNIKVLDAGNTIEGNMVSNSNNGIYFVSPDNSMSGNRFFGNTVDCAGSVVSSMPPVPIQYLPYIITSSGQYYLTGNLSLTDTSAHGIAVNADDVIIDLKDYKITGPGAAGAGSGIYIGDQTNVQIKNGSIGNFGDTGIRSNANSFWDPSYHRVVNIKAVYNGGDGIQLYGTSTFVKECTALYNGGNGVRVMGSAHVEKCNASHNGAHGIYATSSSVIIDNIANNNFGNGISTVGSLIDRNTARFNNQHGENLYVNITSSSSNEYGVNQDSD
ncbi:MAG: right-handed parallel beta-helix repeat-containing protein [Desulfobulbaceae bacterium]|nr:right-handed parallel beta-helix repeat-containing protein [Desulfobulbaceae bacterium]